MNAAIQVPPPAVVYSLFEDITWTIGKHER
jgi:hypothetical protein